MYRKILPLLVVPRLPPSHPFAIPPLTGLTIPPTPLIVYPTTDVAALHRLPTSDKLISTQYDTQRDIFSSKEPRLRLEIYLGAKTGLVQRRRIRNSTAFHNYLLYIHSPNSDTVSRLLLYRICIWYYAYHKCQMCVGRGGCQLELEFHRLKIIRKIKSHKKCSRLHQNQKTGHGLGLNLNE